MPELAEVEKAKNLLLGLTKGKVIQDIQTVEDTIVFSKISHLEFAQDLKGQKVLDVQRYGKWFYFILESDLFALMHFGMTGTLEVPGQESEHYRSSKSSQTVKSESKSNANDDWNPRFCKFTITMDDGTIFSFCDARRLAKITTVRLAKNQSIRDIPPLSELGFDPKLNWPKKDEFASLVTKRKCPIKALLLDQTFSAGIGNWIADECLFHSRIHPKRYCNSLSREELDTLHEKILYVVDLAVDVNADSDKFPKSWLFHHRWGKGKGSVMTGDGHKIEFLTVGGRTSAVVPEFQKMS
ncbi:hypothetical protein BKA69DRAFT_1019999, partial [Paraphysoderma sedebokerense]